MVPIRLRLLALIVAPVLGGCGLEQLGVISIEIPLAPVAVATWPAGIDPSSFVALPLASGTAATNVPSEVGKVDASPLPDLPEGFRYDAVLGFVEDVRAELPGGVVSTTGALVPRHGGVVITDVTLALAPGTTGFWSKAFLPGDLGGLPLGGLRRAKIDIVAEDGAQTTILAGVVPEEVVGTSPSAGGGGHVH